jgi:hypothetical protein
MHNRAHVVDGTHVHSGSSSTQCVATPDAACVPSIASLYTVHSVAPARERRRRCMYACSKGLGAAACTDTPVCVVINLHVAAEIVAALLGGQPSSSSSSSSAGRQREPLSLVAVTQRVLRASGWRLGEPAALGEPCRVDEMAAEEFRMMEQGHSHWLSHSWHLSHEGQELQE